MLYQNQSSSASSSRNVKPDPHENNRKSSKGKKSQRNFVGDLCLKGAEKSPGMEERGGITSARRDSRKARQQSSEVKDGEVSAGRESQVSERKEPSESPRKLFFGKAITSLPRKSSKQKSESSLKKAPYWGRRRKKSPVVPLAEDDNYSPEQTDLRSLRAAQALDKLQAQDPNSVNSRLWTLDDEEILSDNIGLLVRSIETTPPPSITGSSPRRRKRCYSESREIDDSEIEESSPSSQAGGKRTKLSTHKNFIRRRVALEELAPQPIRIDYAAHPLTDRSDQWFITMFRRLFHMCDSFAETFFGIHDLESAGEFFEPWAAVSSLEFIGWAEQVCEEDGFLGGWDFVLRNTAHRRWLVMAVLVRVLKFKVFDEDLWGAGEEEKEILFGIEKALLNREGFERTLLRSQTVRTILGRSPVTQHFYPSVAHLTAQITLLLKPLSDYLTSIPPSTAHPHPNPQDQYQALHNIISTAAYLSLCIRLSPTIFHLVDVSLGEAYDDDDQWNLEGEYYERSRNAALASWTRERRTWEGRMEDAGRAVQRTIREGKEEEKEGMRANEVYQAILAEQPNSPNFIFKAMAKMSVWPVITRYKPGGEQDDLNEANGVKVNLWDRDGFRIFQISKGAVVSYHGRRDRAGKIPLQDFVDGKKKALHGRERGIWNVGLAATTAAVIGAGWVWKEILREKMGIDLTEPFFALGDLVRAK